MSSISENSSVGMGKHSRLHQRILHGLTAQVSWTRILGKYSNRHIISTLHAYEHQLTPSTYSQQLNPQQIVQDSSTNSNLHGHLTLVDDASMDLNTEFISTRYNGLQLHSVFTNSFNPLTAATSQSYRSQRVPLNGSCSYCSIKIAARPEKPFWLCPGCGPKSPVCYCSRECLLSHAFDHSTVCNISSFSTPRG